MVVLAVVGVVILEINDSAVRSSRRLVCEGNLEEMEKLISEQVSISH